VPNHTDGARIDHYDSGNLQLRWTRMHGAEAEFWIQFSYAERTHRDWLPYMLAGRWDYPLSLSYRDRRADIEMQQTSRVGETVRAVWGAQFRQDGAQSRTYFGTSDWEQSSLYRILGNLEWRPSPLWTASGGVMLEKNSLTGTSRSPSLAVNRQVLPGHTLRLRLSNAHRTPTLFEENVNQRYEAPDSMKAFLAAVGYSSLTSLPLAQSRLTSVDLKDERIRSREISYLGQFPAQRLNVDLSLFQHRMDGLIGWYRYPYATIMGQLPRALGGHPDYGYTYGYVNGDSARVLGQSASIDWRPLQGTRLYLAGSRTVIHADGPQASLLSSSGPVHTASLLLSQELPANWQGSVGYYRVGPMAVLSGGDPLPATDRVDLRLAKRFPLGHSRAEVALVVQNATDSIPVFELKDLDRRTAWLNIRYEY
jgi:iron complex outermembrane recepter protein